MSENFNSKVVKATKWSTVTEVLVKILSPITNMILARILTPEAFGVVATITMITSLAEIFADAGFQNFLVQHEFKNKEELDNSTTVAFWSNFMISIVIYLLIFITRNHIARMLGSPKLGFAISLASLNILLSTFSGIHIARYRRNFDFKTLFFVRIISSGIPFLVTIPMALIYRNYWALLIGTLTTNIINAIGLTIRSDWKPRFYFNIRHFKEMFSFSMWTFLDIITMWLVSYTGTFIVGYYLSDYYLGLYKISITTVDSYMAIITGSTAAVLFSALSRLKDNQKEYEKTLFKFQRMISMFVMPMGIGLFLYRSLATKILLGSQWTEAKDFIGLWALISAINVIFGQNISEVFRSKGKPQLALLTQFLHLIVLVPALIITSQINFRVLYISRSLIKLEYVFVGLILLWIFLKLSFIRILKNVAPTIIASLLMGGVALVLQQIGNSVIWEFISIFICILVYFGIIISIPSMRRDLMEIKFVKKILRKVKLLASNEKLLRKSQVNLFRHGGKKLNIAVAGTGYVGLVAGVCFAEIGHKVICVDTDKEKVELMKSGISPIYEADLEELMKRNYEEGRLDYTTDYGEAYKNADAIFIGVGTPELPDGSANLSYIATVARQIAETVEQDCLVVVKSTVPVGTNDKVEQFIKDFLTHKVKIEVASNPEFLAQGTAVRDTFKASRVIIGTNSKKAEDKLRKIYEPFDLPIVSVSRRSAEMIKYASNNFLALKISYMNDIANLCELVGADIEEVAKGMSYDTRIGSSFLNAGIGYGGSCFPKDTKALKYLAKQLGYDLKTVGAAVDVNKDQKTKLFTKASKRLITFQGLKVAVLGLSFKPGTDDLREAPSLDNIALLLEQGASIYAYDPVAVDNYKKRYPNEIVYTQTPEEALEGANVCFIYTEWKEIKEVTPDIYKKYMRTPLVYDGRNIYKPEKMKKAGVEYYSIGR